MNTAVTQLRMAAIFNEWARRYAADPSEFSSILGSDGRPVSDYGESCALYFDKLSREMDAENLLAV